MIGSVVSTKITELASSQLSLFCYALESCNVCHFLDSIALFPFTWWYCLLTYCAWKISSLQDCGNKSYILPSSGGALKNWYILQLKAHQLFTHSILEVLYLHTHITKNWKEKKNVEKTKQGKAIWKRKDALSSKWLKSVGLIAFDCVQHKLNINTNPNERH